MQILPALNPMNINPITKTMSDIIEIPDADKLAFVDGLRNVSTWSHSVNQHNGFWEPLNSLHTLSYMAGHETADKMKREIVLGRIALIHTEQSEAVEAVRKHSIESWSSTEKDSFAIRDGRDGSPHHGPVRVAGSAIGRSCYLGDQPEREAGFSSRREGSVKKFHIYAVVTGSKYLGEIEAESKEEAIEKGANMKSTSISLCHQCSRECENPESTEIIVEES